MTVAQVELEMSSYEMYEWAHFLRREAEGWPMTEKQIEDKLAAFTELMEQSAGWH